MDPCGCNAIEAEYCTSSDDVPCPCPCHDGFDLTDDDEDETDAFDTELDDDG